MQGKISCWLCSAQNHLVGAYKVSVFHLGIPGRGCAANQGWLPLEFQSGTGDTGHMMSATACLGFVDLQEIIGKSVT